MKLHLSAKSKPPAKHLYTHLQHQTDFFANLQSRIQFIKISNYVFLGKVGLNPMRDSSYAFKNTFSVLGQNQLLLTKQSFVQELVDVFNNYAKYYDRGRITVKITGALLYVFQHIVGSSKLK